MRIVEVSAEQKTVPTDESVAKFLAVVPGSRRRGEGEALTVLIGEVAGVAPVMRGPSIVGYSRYHYRYRSGHAGALA